MHLKNLSGIDYKRLNEFLFVDRLVESETVEFKRELPKVKDKLNGHEFAKDVVAFANAKGGLLLVGIDEKQLGICGFKLDLGNQKVEDWISNVLNDFVDQKVDYETKIVPISNEGDLIVLLVKVLEGQNKPSYVVKGSRSIPYLRKGTSVFEASPSDIALMYQSRQRESKKTVRVDQKASGKNIQQVGQNFGQVIQTNQIKNVTNAQPNPEIHISESEAKRIKDKVDEIVRINDNSGKLKSQEDKKRMYSQLYSSIKNRFKVTSYKFIPKEEFKNCYEWLQKEIAGKHTPKLRRSNNPEWRKKRYGSIYTKARQVGLEKPELLLFAEERLNLKAPIQSLKDLGEQNLDKLYKILFSKEFR
ncbi:MAG: hypothetical protein Roseis2KO_32790 [Roseivirga sp.]